MKKYQAVLKYYGNDGLTKTVPVGPWYNDRNTAVMQLVVSIRDRAQNDKVPDMVEDDGFPVVMMFVKGQYNGNEL